ncbi:hypothetical protein [Aurantibacter sp.]|uniref:hypothetical protein n=1 Tax=Aurantibacter sp. TaxID=2807103 RepID=UPI0035C8011E
MKKIHIVLFIFLVSVISFAQAPEGFNYQAVARDASGDIIANTIVGVEFQLHKTTISGSVIYTETHSPTTNTYGVFNLIVGQGASTDTFNTIDWATDLYFIETSIDVSNGSTYVSIGTTQLLSVPYALNAKTADNVFSGNYNDLTNLPNIPTNSTYSVGDFAHGGVVFWVDSSGQHGLVCAITDQSSQISSYGNRDFDAPYQEFVTGDGIYGGKMATSFITSYYHTGTHPAKICQESIILSFRDWYLPSKEELNLMYLNKSTINTTCLANGGTAFNEATYWSSSNYTGGSSNLWLQWFTDGNQYAFGSGVDYPNSYVRAIRAF